MASRGKSRVGGSTAGSVSTTTTNVAAEPALDGHTLVGVLEYGARGSPKLGPVWEMVQRTAAMAGTVVKGTDSQRSFNVEFANLCRACLSSAGELEDAAFEMANPGRRAWDARSEEVGAISDAELMRAIAQHIASQSSTLTAQYLEHIASSAAQKVTRQSRKRERPPASGTRGMGASRSAARVESHRLSSAAMLAPDDSTLGLLDESATTQAALQQLLSSQAGPGLGEREAHAVASSLAAQAPAPVTPGQFYSKGTARARNAAGRTFDLRNPSLRLSAIPELSRRLQPWLLPMSQYDGLAIDRVVPEKERRAPHHHHHHHSTSALAGSGSGGAPTEPVCLAMLDVCGADTPHELLQRWEAREAALAVLKASVIGPPHPATALPTSAAPALPLTTAQTSSPPHEGDAPTAPDTDGTVKTDDADDDDDDSTRAFFVNPSKSVESRVPKAIIAAQVHFGVWKLEFPQYAQP